ncbi:MAG: hypothetical protein RSB78_03035 [Oscillospiraceae bacterium]
MKSSIAYSNFDRNLSTSEAEEQKRLQIIKTQRSRAKEKRAFVAKLSAFSLVIVMLMITTVYSRLVLTETRSKINGYTSELTELESENAYLSYKLESLVSLKKAETYAVSELGLIKMDSSRIEYVNLQDSNEVIADENDTTIGEDFDTFFNAVIDFFGG